MAATFAVAGALRWRTLAQMDLESTHGQAAVVDVGVVFGAGRGRLWILSPCMDKLSPKPQTVPRTQKISGKNRRTPALRAGGGPSTAVVMTPQELRRASASEPCWVYDRLESNLTQFKMK